MCEWNVKLGPDGKIAPRETDSLYAVAAYLWFKVRPWTHGDGCRWGRRLRFLAR